MLLLTIATMYFIGSLILYPFFIYNGLGTIYDLLVSALLIIPALFGQFLGSKIRHKISNKVFRKFTLVCAINNKKVIGWTLYEKGGMNGERMVTFIDEFI